MRRLRDAVKLSSDRLVSGTDYSERRGSFRNTFERIAVLSLVHEPPGVSVSLRPMTILAALQCLEAWSNGRVSPNWNAGFSRRR